MPCNFLPNKINLDSYNIVVDNYHIFPCRRDPTILGKTYGKSYCIIGYTGTPPISYYMDIKGSLIHGKSLLHGKIQ